MQYACSTYACSMPRAYPCVRSILNAPTKYTRTASEPWEAISKGNVTIMVNIGFEFDAYVFHGLTIAITSSILLLHLSFSTLLSSLRISKSSAHASTEHCAP